MMDCGWAEGAMTDILMRLTALCMLTAFSEQLTSGSAVKGGVRLICGLIAAQLILNAVLALPGILFPG